METNRWIWVFVGAVIAATSAFGAANAPERAEAAKRSVVEANNRFALDLYAKLRGREGNLFVSPYSISTALAMTYAGAQSRTALQMVRVLHFPIEVNQTGQSASAVLDSRQFASAFGEIIGNLNDRGKKGGYTLTVANALWGQKDYGFLKEYLELIETNYGGRLNEVDFVAAAEAARKTINAWVEKQTKNKIKDLIPPGVLDSMTRLVLTNAIYFKGNWAGQFKESQTRDAPFTLTDSRRVQAPMMNQTAEFGYMETETFQSLELPYVDNELSMIILLPRKPNGLSELEAALNQENFSQWLGKLYRREVIVSVPKFKATSQFSLASVLASMGMKDAFTSDADFSGINGRKDLFISAVIHKAYVDVNEEGTEAAAATGVTMRLTSIGPSRKPVFRADHPFLFLIRDNQSGSILFLGRVANPTE